MHSSFYLFTLSKTKLSQISRPLTCVTSPHCITPNSSPLNPSSHIHLVHSILSNTLLDSSNCQSLIPHLSPLQFDHFFLSIKSNVNIKTTLQFFHLAAHSYNFKFTVRSYCLLTHLLVCNNLLYPARLILIRLIDGNLPALFGDHDNECFIIMPTGHFTVCQQLRITSSDIKEDHVRVPIASPASLCQALMLAHQRRIGDLMVSIPCSPPPDQLKCAPSPVRW